MQILRFVAPPQRSGKLTDSDCPFSKTRLSQRLPMASSLSKPRKLTPWKESYASFEAGHDFITAVVKKCGVVVGLSMSTHISEALTRTSEKALFKVARGKALSFPVLSLKSSLENHQRKGMPYPGILKRHGYRGNILYAQVVQMISMLLREMQWTYFVAYKAAHQLNRLNQFIVDYLVVYTERTKLNSYGFNPMN